jgi:hypothetical protein
MSIMVKASELFKFPVNAAKKLPDILGELSMLSYFVFGKRLVLLLRRNS